MTSSKTELDFTSIVNCSNVRYIFFKPLASIEWFCLRISKSHIIITDCIRSLKVSNVNKVLLMTRGHKVFLLNLRIELLLRLCR